MEKYDVSVFSYKDLKNIMVIPRFQRSPIWSDDKRKGLIDTIKKGLPIGSILLSKKGGKYELIDGLQRMTTLADFEKNRFKYVDEMELTDEELIKIINCDKEKSTYAKQLLKTQRKFILSNIRKIIIKQFHNTDYNNNQIHYDIADQLKEEVPVLRDYNSRKIYSICEDLVKKINNILDVNELKIPVIIFKNQGSSSNSELIDIFTKLNSEGVKLSKYDIFSAKWQNCIIKINNNNRDQEYNRQSDNIISVIIKKYENSTEVSGLEISDLDYDDLKETREINIFEYAYAISKVISNESKFLFKAKNNDKVDSLGFTLLSGIFDLSNKNMDTLGEIIMTYKIDFVKLLIELLKVVKELESILDRWLVGPSNTYLCCHSELQLASYILVLFKLMYRVETNEIKHIKKINDRKIKTFKCYLHKHYLYDIIRGYWAGSGDSKLDEIVLYNLETCRYLGDVDINSFEIQIDSWLKEENNKFKSTISKEIKLFLNYIHVYEFPHKENQKFDYDHICTKESLKEHFKNKNINVPISTPCNLSLIPIFDNRSKRELTYYQLIDQRKNSYILNEILLDKCCYPSRNELAFTVSEDTFTQENYLYFINERRKYLTRKIIQCLYPKSE